MPKERVYAEMRRQVGEFPAANHTSEAMVPLQCINQIVAARLRHC